MISFLLSQGYFFTLSNVFAFFSSMNKFALARKCNFSLQLWFILRLYSLALPLRSPFWRITPTVSLWHVTFLDPARRSITFSLRKRRAAKKLLRRKEGKAEAIGSTASLLSYCFHLSKREKERFEVLMMFNRLELFLLEASEIKKTNRTCCFFLPVRSYFIWLRGEIIITLFCFASSMINWLLLFIQEKEHLGFTTCTTKCAALFSFLPPPHYEHYVVSLTNDFVKWCAWIRSQRGFEPGKQAQIWPFNDGMCFKDVVYFYKVQFLHRRLYKTTSLDWQHMATTTKRKMHPKDAFYNSRCRSSEQRCFLSSVFSVSRVSTSSG